MSKQSVTPLESALLVIGVFVLAFVTLGFTAWVVMLLLGALGSELGFTGPSYFVTFIGVWLVKIVAAWFKPSTTVKAD